VRERGREKGEKQVSVRREQKKIGCFSEDERRKEGEKGEIRSDQQNKKRTVEKIVIILVEDAIVNFYV
jgi:hypothetical protein